VRLAAALASVFSCLAHAGQHAPMEGHEAGVTLDSQDRAGHSESGEAVADIAADALAPLQLSRAWVRAMPPGRDMTAAYLTVTNPTDSAITIRGARASRGDASLHENRRVDGQVQMRALAELTIPAHAEIKLEPGGLHIMLMDLGTTPAEGEQVRLCLVSTAGTVCAEAPVLRRAPDATTSPAADAGHRH
jgi:copper(I)-binding protein